MSLLISLNSQKEIHQHFKCFLSSDSEIFMDLEDAHLGHLNECIGTLRLPVFFNSELDLCIIWWALLKTG